MNNESPLYKSLTELEASFEVVVKASYYPHEVKVFIPVKPFQKLRPGMELGSKPKIKAGAEKSNQEDDEARSLRRTKKAIRDYVLCNEFEHFVTFTFAEERQDPDRCRSRMSNWLKNQQKRSGRFLYLIVAERHKDGALHFHALFKGFRGKIEPAIHPGTGTPLRQRGKPVFHLPSYRSGFTNVKETDATPDSHSKMARYVSKYITKDMPLFGSKNRYWVSPGLKIPVVVYNPPPWYLEEAPSWSHTSDYGTTLVFPYRSRLDSLGDVIDSMERE